MYESKRFTGIVQIYSKYARDRIYDAGKSFLTGCGLPGYEEDVFACVDELIKNAVKANYKLLVILDHLREDLAAKNPLLSEEEINASLAAILKKRHVFDELSTGIITGNHVSRTVRAILNEEAAYLSIKNRAYLENRRFSDSEVKKIGSLHLHKSIREKIRKQDIKILLTLEADGGYLNIEVTNTAPIISRDIKRIHEKREEFLKCRLDGRECDFFVNNIDTSEAGFGLGYAKIDSYLAGMGLDPQSSISIITANNTTVLLTIPIAALAE